MRIATGLPGAPVPVMESVGFPLPSLDKAGCGAFDGVVVMQSASPPAAAQASIIAASDG